MKWPVSKGGVRIGLGLFALAVLLLAVLRWWERTYPKNPEIALVIGEPWETMRQRSSARIDPAIPNEIWYTIPKSDARLRFADPQYGFITPLARFFTVSYIKGRVDSVRMSPQIEPLPLDDALKVVLDLQAQWVKAGWEPIHVRDDPPIADTLQWRANLAACESNVSYWSAGQRFQIMLGMACFQDDKHPDETRYLITLALAKPWVDP
ncbi:hypothetical protein C7401_107227 [Paraburkholderia unamae]|uniref:hypothetical protein n=1 Tax=Paraburkholderia unamae TaxID=219649 RepID=UPI000DC52B10|nr:hypothetical protein [Paraburkholderia unamae]RAR61903.1 hypothetical protein C7401_107227 [Paraburkholderia unamae]